MIRFKMFGRRDGSGDLRFASRDIEVDGVGILKVKASVGRKRCDLCLCSDIFAGAKPLVMTARKASSDRHLHKVVMAVVCLLERLILMVDGGMLSI
jgi:hypothetical protein